MIIEYFWKIIYSVLYKNRNYFYTILSSIVSLKLDIDDIDRKDFKKCLPFVSENDMRNIVDEYFDKMYKINTKNLL